MCLDTSVPSVPTSADMSYGQFGTGAEVSRGPKCLYNVDTEVFLHRDVGSFGLDVSVSRRSRDVVSKRLGLVETWEGLGLDLVSDSKSNVSVSYHTVSFPSRYAQLFASLQNCTYIVLNARRLYCLLIHKLRSRLHSCCILVQCSAQFKKFFSLTLLMQNL